MPIEKASTDLNRMCWNPDYRSIASFLDCFIVYAKNTDPTLIIEYSGGDEKVVLINMDVTTGELDGDSKDVQETLKAWYNDNKVKLIKIIIVVAIRFYQIGIKIQLIVFESMTNLLTVLLKRYYLIV